MAATLTFKPAASLLHSLVPPPSQEFAMQVTVPDVFVTPPEEELEYNPPFCYFDAAEAARHSLSTGPDIHALDVALGLCQQTDNRAPTFTRLLQAKIGGRPPEAVVMPRRASALKLQDMNMDVDEEALEAENGLPDIRSRRRDDASSANFDSEIIEVVKVRRNEGVADVGEGRNAAGTQKMKRSTTFRARASQALRSIKLNVGGGSSAKTRRATVSEQAAPSPAQHASTLPLRGSLQDIAPSSPSPKSPTMSRRRSLTLSQLFMSHKENQASRPGTPSEEPMSPTSPTLVSTESTSSRPMSPTDTLGSYPRSLRPSPSFEEEDNERTPTKPPTLGSRSLNAEESSKPTLSKRKSFRRRLSVLELQKIFTLGGSSAPSNPPNSAAPPPLQDSTDDMFSPARPRSRSVEFGSILSPSSTRSTVSFGDMLSRPSATSLQTDDMVLSEDDELEMRLDSLHFDSLHFDPEEIMTALGDTVPPVPPVPLSARN